MSKSLEVSMYASYSEKALLEAIRVDQMVKGRALNAAQRERASERLVKLNAERDARGIKS